MSIIISLIASVVVFAFSLTLFPYYKGGDVSVYLDVYHSIQKLNFNEAIAYYNIALNSTGEIISAFFSTVPSQLGWDYYIISSLYGAVLVFFLSLYLLEILKISSFMLVIVVFSFYQYTVLFPAERLRYALLILLAALTPLSWNLNNKRVSNILLVVSIFAHTSISLISIPVLLTNMGISLNKIQTLVRKASISKSLLLPLILVTASIPLFFASRSNEIIIKLLHYGAQGEGKSAHAFLNLCKVVLFVIIANQRRVISARFFYGIPILLFAIFLPNERTVHLSYIFMLLSYYFGRKLSVVDAPYLLISLYLFLKGFSFVNDVIEFGYGVS